jgi:Arc/MetJ-type ribon-helix-helix transcriptional regulator
MPDVFMNIRIEEQDERMLELMMKEDFFDNRSAFIRKLIRQEWARRYSQPSLFNVEDAIKAGEAIRKEGGK